MALSLTRPVTSLKTRWQALCRRWTWHVVWPMQDLLGFSVGEAAPPKRRSVPLDILPLEHRELPAFGISLFANAVPDPLQGTSQLIGRTTAGVSDGNAQLNIPFDVFRSDSGGPSALVYNSNTVDVRPVVTVQVTSAGGDPVPSSIVATLTFNGVADNAVTFTTTGHSAGDTYLLGVQHATQITASGYYSYSMAVTVNITGQSPVNLTQSGSMPLVVRDTSSDYFGRGWGVAGLDSLVSVSGGFLYVYGTGGARYFSGSGPTYTSPANDFGTLARSGSPGNYTYTYTATDQSQVKFDTNGKITSRVDPHGLPVTFSYNSGRLYVVSTFDGASTTFTYDGSNLLQTIVQPGTRTLTFAHASGSDLTTLTNPDGGLRTFTYSGAHKLTVENFGDQTITMSYDGTTGMLSSVNRGGGSTQNVTPVLSVGLTTTPAKNASAGVGVIDDGLSHNTTYVLDSEGRITQKTLADGGVYAYTLNGAGLPTKYTDPLSKVTSYTYAANTADVTKIELPDGGVISMTYDATYHKVTERIDQLGNRTTMTYDANTGDLLTVKDALNNTTTYAWGQGGLGLPKGLLESITDPLGRITTFQYATARRNTTIVDPSGGLTTMTYDAAGNITVKEIPFDNGGQLTAGVNTFTYDSMRRVTAKIDGNGGQSTFAFNALGQMNDTTDQLGRRGTYVYDVRGNMIGLSEAIGTSDLIRTASTFDAGDNVTTQTDAGSNVSTFTYDAVGRLATVKDALNGVATTTYDSAGRVSTQADQLNHKTTFSYDDVGRLTVVQNALGDRTTTSYDLAGNVRSVKDALGVVTSYAYDAVNRTTQINDDKGGSLERTTTITYDAVGNVLTRVDGRGNTTSFAYDSLNRQTSMTDALGHVTSTTYNASSREIATWQDALGFTVTRTYDKIGQLESVSRPEGGTFTYVYDAAGNNTVQINELGNRVTFTFDYLNRNTVITDSLTGKTTFVYDANDNRTVVVDPVGNRSTFAFDALNRVTTETDPLNKSATFAYDAASRLTSTTDRISTRRIDFTYDDTNHKLTEKWYTSGSLDQTQTFSYDALGQMLTAVDPDGTNTFTYDALHRVKTVNEPFGLTLTYTYDAADNRTVTQDSKGGLASMTFDAANRRTSTQFTGNSGTLRFDYAYTARDQISGLTRYSNLAGTTTIGWTSYTYDNRGRMTNLEHRDGSNTSLENTTYTFDTHDRLSTKVVNGTTTTYTYDTTDQLTNDGAAYSYDSNGNRNMSGYTTGTGNRTTNDGTWTYSYDDAGNRTKRSKGANLETWTYGYDHRNNLIWVEKRATDGGTLQSRVDYKYDALGQRIERLVDSDGNGTTDETNRYGLGGPHVWAVLDGNNNLGSRRLFGDSIDSPVVRVSSAGTVVWYLTDYQDSVTQLVNASGATLGTISYDGFGKIVTDTTGANGDGFKYTGREWDATVQLQYNRARYYDPALGKWVTMDPIGFDAGDANLYRYVGNGPTNHLDPVGLAEVPMDWQDYNDIKTKQEGYECLNPLTAKGNTYHAYIRVKGDGFFGLGIVALKDWVLVAIEERWEVIEQFHIGPGGVLKVNWSYESTNTFKADVSQQLPISKGFTLTLSAQRAVKKAGGIEYTYKAGDQEDKWLAICQRTYVAVNDKSKVYTFYGSEVKHVVYKKDLGKPAAKLGNPRP